MGCPESSRSSPTRRRRPRVPPVRPPAHVAAAAPAHRSRSGTRTNCKNPELEGLSPPASSATPPFPTSITPSPAAGARFFGNGESGRVEVGSSCIGGLIKVRVRGAVVVVDGAAVDASVDTSRPAGHQPARGRGAASAPGPALYAPRVALRGVRWRCLDRTDEDCGFPMHADRAIPGPSARHRHWDRWLRPGRIRQGTCASSDHRPQACRDV